MVVSAFAFDLVLMVPGRARSPVKNGTRQEEQLDIKYFKTKDSGNSRLIYGEMYGSASLIPQ